MRRAFPCGAFLAAMSLAALAPAQSAHRPSPVADARDSMRSLRSFDGSALGQATASWMRSFALAPSMFEPLRLGLGPSAHDGPDCLRGPFDVEARGAEVPGFRPRPVMRFVPRLTLDGFTSTECGVDAMISGGAPFRPKVWLASSNVALYLPHDASSEAALARANAARELLFDLRPVSSRSVVTRGITIGEFY